MSSSTVLARPNIQQDWRVQGNETVEHTAVSSSAADVRAAEPVVFFSYVGHRIFDVIAAIRQAW